MHRDSRYGKYCVILTYQVMGYFRYAAATVGHRAATFGHSLGPVHNRAVEVGSGLEDDPAGDAAGGFHAVRPDRLRERVHRADLRTQVPLVDEAGELG